MSDSFYNQSLSPPQQTASLKARKTRGAPPPPPARSTTANASSASSSYYGNSTFTQQQQQPRSSAPPPPQRPVQPQSQTRTTASTSHSGGAATSFYGNKTASTSSATNNRTAGGYSSGTSYYGTPAPAAYNGGTSTTTTTSSFANTGNTAAAPDAVNTNSEWQSATANSNSTSDWYSAPQQQQQQQQQYQFHPSQPAQPQPAYSTDFAQASSFPTSTPLTTTELAGSIGASTIQPEQAHFSTFIPQPATMQSSSNIYENDLDFTDETPLLEELGVNLQHILLKTKAVVLPFSKFGMQAQQVLHEDDNDLAGPLVFCLLLGGELLLSGKLQFSYIYGYCSFGCILLTLVLNLMSPLPVSIWTVASILGYALLPVNILAIFKIVLVDLIRLSKVQYILAILTIFWCTVASTRLLEQKCGMRAQRYLLAYPIALLYSAFVMITIF